LQLLAIGEIIQVSPSTDPKVNRFAQGQHQVLELTEGLLTSFVLAEEVALQYRHTEMDTILYSRFTELVQELFTGLGMMDDENLQQMSWMNPVLLNFGIRSKNENLRYMVQKLVARTSASSSVPAVPYPPPSTVVANENDNTTITKDNNENYVGSDSTGIDTRKTTDV
jgi:hypothetical protein